jgi:hypothetical protein
MVPRSLNVPTERLGAATGVPHEVQKSACAGIEALHFLQFMRSSFSDAAV